MSIDAYKDPYLTRTAAGWVNGNPYVGRGLICGLTKDAKKAVTAYFIMGRSDNSRNRVFEEEGENVIIKPFDPSKVEDPSLIIYYPLKVVGKTLIVTNGDQTDTIETFAKQDRVFGGHAFEDALNTRCFEPDGPNWTPRISGVMNLDPAETFGYKLSILKSEDPEGTQCGRYYFNYTGIPGLGHFIHTYITDGSPIPTFTGEPHRVDIPDTPDELADQLWENLNVSNKISLYVRYIDLASGASESRLINNNR